MIYSTDDFRKLLEHYFFLNGNLPSIEEAVFTQRQMFTDTFSLYIEEHLQSLGAHLPKVIQLIHVLLPNIEKGDDPRAIMLFMDSTLTTENSLSHRNPYSIATLFATDEELSNSLKNLYMFRIIEKIRFAKLQRESLRDTSSYNRHIAKALTAMSNSLRVLFELKASYDEVEAVLDKYYEFNRHVNTPDGWSEFFSLKEYGPFQMFLQLKNIDENSHS